MRPDGTIRRSQVVTTFGPGAMVDLLDHAVIVSGLERWHHDGKDVAHSRIIEPRLREALIRRGWELSEDTPFRAPPVGGDEPSPHAGIDVFEFPTWFVCQNPACRALVGRRGLELKGGRYVHDCDRKKPHPCVPVRFVAACARGHIDDFPWVWFAHHGRVICAAPRLQLLEGATGDFSEVRVRCQSCDAEPRRLADALVKEVSADCSGRRPWLAADAREECDSKIRLLVRTASNTYFPQLMSALSIPDADRALEEAVAGVWTILQAATAETLPSFRQIPGVRDAIGDASDDDVLAVVQARLGGDAAPREPLRTAEFKQLTAAPPGSPADSPPPDKDFFARRVTELVDEGGLISSVVLVHKLREVRAQVGFTRLEPPSPDLQGELDLGVELAPLSLTTDWLPAFEIKGEGVLICLDEKRVVQWEQRPAVIERAKELLAGFEAWNAPSKAKGKEDHAFEFPGARFYLLHSLSHLLISAISLECGYAASAIRERIYCAPPNSPTPMAAVLLSTGTAGSEGTLGGLVEQGAHLREHLRDAYDLGRLCSNDPVCASHSPKHDHAERFLEGAACHGCLYIAEPSCERFNRYLDRALVVPTLGHDPALAFFSERPR